ncbi:hypothetical protein [Microbacterium sp.]|uniref:hypothetical protein n=1 Tax=Microbacterium sp. TaxID=51671 RepID=UPI003A85CD5C
MASESKVTAETYRAAVAQAETVPVHGLTPDGSLGRLVATGHIVTAQAAIITVDMLPFPLVLDISHLRDRCDGGRKLDDGTVVVDVVTVHVARQPSTDLGLGSALALEIADPVLPVPSELTYAGRPMWCWVFPMMHACRPRP